MTPLLAQLYAMQAQLAAAIAFLESQEGPPADKPPCRHPPDRQVDASTFGHPGDLCLDCGVKHPKVPA